MQIFFAEILSGQSGQLTEEEARHCQKVLRHQPGDRIHVTDGSGNMFLAQIQSFDRAGASLLILETYPGFGESGVKVRLAVSLLRLKDRFEWLMEKAVELGVTEIFPIICERTDKYKGKVKEDRLEKIILTALKQSKRSKLPLFHEAIPFQKFIHLPDNGFRILAWCESEQKIQLFSQDIQNASSVTLVIGPEGDFTHDEVQLARENGYEVVSLGEIRLRTETAAMYVLSVLKMLRE
ncbi:MAG: RsmE family RNA methyltransferase [Bacteroidia bacterium]|nr:RsmE family RNA methyltransferase [Bacteroidia bacterium]